MNNYWAPRLIDLLRKLATVYQAFLNLDRLIHKLLSNGGTFKL